MHQGNRIKIAHCVLYRPVLSNGNYTQKVIQGV